ncbi:hypothetical protein NH340_JMT08926 [Sarcoptes scabiei]|nr:sin3 histone deacetylase corepressor complex component SDS3-like protein [Sarcoptes scabiei]UXI22983.1 hypothetical protein NH340_JMT08926 [Sarcoptes scabiei]
MNDYDIENDRSNHLEIYGDSDEDTEDASETGSTKYINELSFEHDLDEYDSNFEIKEQIYKDKLAVLKEQLVQLEHKKHPDYVKHLAVLDKEHEDRLFFIYCTKKLEEDLIEKEYCFEESAAEKEFEERKMEIKENLLSDLEEKKKINENDSNIELISDPSETKTLTTRKLRRRPNDPIPLPDRRRRASPAQINFLLDENIITEDVKAVNRLLSASTKSAQKNSLTSNKNQNNHHQNHNNDHDDGEHQTKLIEAKIECGKLFCDKKWFHRGQNVFIESPDGSLEPSIILHIGTNDIIVKRYSDSQRIKITLNDLMTKKFSFQKKW